MKKKILISGAGGSVFPYLFTLLENDYELYAVDSNMIVKKIYPDKNIIVVPQVKDRDYEITIEDIIKKESIKYYIPLIDEEILKAHALAARLPGLKVISPNNEFVSLCLNKYNLMKVLGEKSISDVKTILGQDFKFEIGFPVFIKPIIGRGSRGIMKICNKEQFDAYFLFNEYRKKDIIVQRCLEGIEYSVSVIVNKLNNIICIVPKKILIKKGITQHAVTEKNKNINALCKKIVQELCPCGPFNVQLKVTKDGVKVFEINPRFSTTSILSCAAGVNEFALSIEHFDDANVREVDSFKEGVFLYRRYESCFYF